MHLLDQVAQTNQAMVVERSGGRDIWRLPGTDVLAHDLEQCALRYVLHDDVTELCTELAFDDETIVGSSVELIRIPAPTLWIEFSGRAQNKVLSNLGRLEGDFELSPHQRIGLLVKSDASGRKGEFRVCWENESGLGPDIAPFIVEYDFNDVSFSKSCHATADGTMIAADVVGHDALVPLFEHIRFRLNADWHRYYRQSTGSESLYREALHTALNPMHKDIPFLSMFCLLLTSQSAFQVSASDRSRLNRSRARRGRSPLLDHVELTMNLAAHEPEFEDSACSSADRSSPRLHFVRGHLVRRRNAIHWRTSHMRGKPAIGSIHSRTVSLRVTAGSSFQAPTASGIAVRADRVLSTAFLSSQPSSVR